MEQFTQNIEASSEENKPKKESLLKKWLGAGVVAGAALGAVGCNDQSSSTEQANDKQQPQEQKDRFEKASDKIDKKLELREDDLQEAKIMAAKKAILIRNADRVEIKKTGGVIVGVSVNGKSVPLSENDFTKEQINLIKNASEIMDEKYPPANWSGAIDQPKKAVGGEIKTNTDAEEFLK